MYFKIHRGTKEAGGFCVEFLTDKKRIVIDTGMPPPNPDGFPFNDKEFENLPKEELIQKGILPDIPSLYEQSTNTSLYISYSHKYHYELLQHIHPSCPVYMNKTTYLLIRKMCEFLGKEWSFENIKIINGYYDHFRAGDEVDNYVFCINAKLLYLCNLRNHNKKIFDYFLKKHVPIGIDHLLFNGNDTNEKFQTEEEILEELVKIIRIA
jgi:ribonuclease J